MKILVLIFIAGTCSFCSFSVPGINLQAPATNDRTIEAQEENDDTETVKEIESLLTRQAAAWNAGDLPRFMQTYWKSDELTFSSGGKITRGWQATLDRYVKSYAPPKEMGTLTFDNLESTLIEKNAALILGDWHLKMKKGKDRDGNFSLVLRKINGQWRIIHDHSSKLEKNSPTNVD